MSSIRALTSEASAGVSSLSKLARLCRLPGLRGLSGEPWLRMLWRGLGVRALAGLLGSARRAGLVGMSGGWLPDVVVGQRMRRLGRGLGAPSPTRPRGLRAVAGLRAAVGLPGGLACSLRAPAAMSMAPEMARGLWLLGTLAAGRRRGLLGCSAVWC